MQAALELLVKMVVRVEVVPGHFLQVQVMLADILLQREIMEDMMEPVRAAAVAVLEPQDLVELEEWVQHRP